MGESGFPAGASAFFHDGLTQLLSKKHEKPLVLNQTSFCQIFDGLQMPAFFPAGVTRIELTYLLSGLPQLKDAWERRREMLPSRYEALLLLVLAATVSSCASKTPYAQKFQQACENGHAAACFKAGLFYRDGEGVDQDDIRAAELFRKACDHGHAFGCNHLGVSYGLGLGVDRDDAKSTALYQKSCNAGLGIGCFNLATGFFNGDATQRDVTRALKLYEKGCDLGSGESCTALKIAERVR